MRGKFTRNGNILAMAGVAVLAAVGVGYAAIPSADGVINGCYNKAANPSGALRVIDAEAGAKCSKNERALSFNQTGPQGPQGIQGDKGDAGTTAGRITTRSLYKTDMTYEVTLHCEAGEVAVGGGVGGDLPEDLVHRSEPAPGTGTPTGWKGSLMKANGAHGSGTVYVVCMQP